MKNSIGGYPAGADNDSDAPFNQDERHCKVCDSTMFISDSGNTKYGDWQEYTCPECGYVSSNEPNY